MSGLGTGPRGAGSAPWAGAAPVGLGEGARMIDPTWGELSGAVAEQEPMVRRMIAACGRGGDLDLVLGLVLSTAWLKLDSWRAMTPRPALGAWVHGVAVRSVAEWRRRDMTKRGGAGGRVQEVAVDIADLPVEAIPTPDTDSGEVDEQMAALSAALRVLHTAVVARPGGTSAWRRLVCEAMQERRGEVLRDELRVFLDGASTDPAGAVLGPRLRRIVIGAPAQDGPGTSRS
ncbi:MAG TPA: hypothetical protein VGC67_11805 [Cellulomonas sp.]